MFFTSTGNSPNSDLDQNSAAAPRPIEKANVGFWGRGVAALKNVKDGAASKASAAYNAVAWGVTAPVIGTANWIKSTTAATVWNLYSDPISYSLKCFKNSIIGKQPVSDPVIRNRLKSLDEHGKLPAFSAATVAFLIKKIKESKENELKSFTENVPAVVRKNTEEEIKFFSDENGDILTCLTFLLHRMLAYLACYQGVPKGGEQGQLFTNIAQNLFALVSKHASPSLQNRLAEYGWLYAQMNTCLPEQELPIEHRLKELEAKREICATRLDSLAGDKVNFDRCKAELDAINDHIQGYKKLEAEYAQYMGASTAEINSANLFIDAKAAAFMNERNISDFLLKKRSDTIKQLRPLLKDLLGSAGLGEEVLSYFLDGSGLKGGKIESSLKWLAPQDGSNDGKVASYVFDLVLDNCGSLLDMFVAAQTELAKPENEVDPAQELEGHSELQADSKVIAEKMMPTIFGMVGKEEMRAVLAHTIKDNMDDQELTGVDRTWIENLLAKCADGQEKTVNTLWKFVQKLVGSRLSKALGHAALFDSGAEGNVFDRFITNSINAIKEFFNEPSKLNESIAEFDHLSVLADALTWRSRYLREVKGIAKKDCEQAADHLTAVEIAEIYQFAGYNRDQQAALFCEISKSMDIPADYEHVDELVCSFFRGANSEEVEIGKQECLVNAFGPLSDRLLDLLGLSNDADFALPGASGEKDALYNLDSLRKSVLPAQLLELYRHMGDFKGLRANNSHEADTLFGDNVDAIWDFSTVMSHIVNSSVKGMLTRDADNYADKAGDYFPNAKGHLAQTIQAIAAANLGVDSANASAAEEINNYVGRLLQHCIMKVLVAFGKNSKERQKHLAEMHPAEQGILQQIRHAGELLLLGGVSNAGAGDSSKLLGDSLSALAGLFAKHRVALQDGMKEYWVLDQAKRDASKLNRDKSPEEKANAEKVFDDLMIAKKEAIFMPLCQELIELSGLDVKDLSLPEQVEAEVWKIVLDQLQSNLATIYINLTEWERTQKQDAKKLNEIGLIHGAGAASGVSHFTMRIVQSMLAVDNSVFGDNLYAKLLEQIKAPNTIEGNDLAQRLKGDHDGAEIKQVIGENLSAAAKDAEVKEVLSAVENYIHPVVQKTILAIGENLKKVQEKSPSILKKIAKDVVSFTGEHFKKIHAVAIRENKVNPYEVDACKMLEGVTSDENVLGYVLLKEKEKKAKALVHEKKQQSLKWTLTGHGKAEAAREIKQAEKAVADIQKKIKEYVEPRWSDGGIAVEKYLQAERALRKREHELGMAQKSLRQRWENLIHKQNPQETEEVQAARGNCSKAGKQLDKMKEVLDIVVHQHQNIVGYLALNAEKTKATTTDELAAVEDKIKTYVDNRWADGGVAIETYLHAKYLYKQLNDEFIAQQVKRRQIPPANHNKQYRETEEIKTARLIRDKAKISFEEAIIALDSAVYLEEGERLQANRNGKLINLCLEKDYQELEAKLEAAKKAGSAKEVADAQAKLNEYSFNNYYKPLTKKILKLVNEDQFDNVPFPEIFKDYKSDIIKLAKAGLLPSVLGNIIQTVCKPENLLSMALSAVKKLNDNADAPAPVQTKPKPTIALDDEFDSVCGGMIIDAIEMGALGIEGDLFSSLIKSMDVQGSAGKALGAALREFLEKQSLTGLLDTALESGAGSLLPDGKWNDNKEFMLGRGGKQLPQNAADAEADKAEQLANIKKTEREFKEELAKLALNNTKAQALSLVSGFSKPWETIKSFVHSTIDSLGELCTEKLGEDCREMAERVKADFDEFSKNLYDVVAAVAKLIVRFVIWPVVRFVNLYLSSKVSKIKEVVAMPIHKRLIFQIINIVVGTLEDEVADLKKMKAKKTRLA